MKNATNGGVNILRAVVLVLGGAVAWILLTSAQAGAITVADQESTTTNVGVGVANTGVNGAVGNASTNDSSVDQDATAIGGGDDTVAVNNASTSNNSGGNASINTGNANATGNSSATSNTQALHTGDDDGIVIADQEANTTNVGVGVANTGFNAAGGNLSTNTSDVDQDATAIGGADDTVAVNTADVSNNSTGSALIVTGNANAIGNSSSTHNTQVIDTGDSDLVVTDQTNSTVNLGFGLANSGFNIVGGNLSTNTADPINQSAVAIGGEDAVAVNDASAVNNSTGNAAIATGNANAIGNTSHDHNTQVLHADGVAAMREGANAAIPFALLLAFLFVGTPVRRLAIRRR